ncbi:MAG: hypothetical protein FJ108_05365 [Deltaproteobacteria bacterium]|nr:hypothetical protein [Deltaproteobacteria bacterium]
MACCAFALFILGQIAAGFVALRRAVPFGLLGRPSLEPTVNAATVWQLGAQLDPVAPGAGAARWRSAGRAVAAAALLELALVGAAAAWGLHGAHASAHAAEMLDTDTFWCGRMLP